MLYSYNITDITDLQKRPIDNTDNHQIINIVMSIKKSTDLNYFDKVNEEVVDKVNEEIANYERMITFAVLLTG